MNGSRKKRKRTIHFSDEAVRFIIRRYTREAGMRNLERLIGTICRKQARRIAEGTREKTEVTAELVEKDLDAPRFRTATEVAERTRRPGVAVRLAWTPVGATCCSSRRAGCRAAARA